MEEKPTTPPRKSFTMRIGIDFFNQLKKHMRLLKNLKDQRTKQKWIEEAIEQKLYRWQKLDFQNDEINDKFLSFKISSHIGEEVEIKIEEAKMYGIKKTKKQFFLEAITEKLQLEEAKVEEKSKKLLQNMIKTNSVPK